MKSDKGIRISQCMIVKNEERNIEKALSWGKDIMWEQIVVDTGSTDRTVEIAKNLGAKVFFFEWIDDFSAAKNYAIKMARGDWIAFLDADEYMNPEDSKKMKGMIKRLSKDTFDGISTGWQQLDNDGKIFSSGTQVRFFRNLPDIGYRRRIHEQLESFQKRKLRIGDMSQEISIFHTGYQGKSWEDKKKSGRNKKLILQELQDNSSDYEMMGYMGDEYFNENQMEEAEQWYRRAIMHMPPELASYDQRSAVTFTRLLLLLLEKDGASWETAREVYRQAVRLLPEEADFDYVVGRFFVYKEMHIEALEYLEKSLEKLNSYGCYNKALLLAANLLEVYGWLVRCCYSIGKLKNCVSYAITYLKYNKYGMDVLSYLLKTLLSDSRNLEIYENQDVLEVLLKIYDIKELKDRLFILKTAERAELCEFAGFVAERLFTSQEYKLLGIGKEEHI